MKRLAALACALAPILWACADRNPEPPVPADTTPVLKISGRVITAEEVDALARHIADLQPQRSFSEHRRMALVNLFVPRAAVAALEGSAWTRARDAARASHARALAAPEDPAAESSLVHGGWQQLGLATWAGLREAPVGVWLGPFEEVGRFVVARRLDPAAGPVFPDEYDPLALHAELIVHMYQPPDFDRERLELALRRARGEWYDPDWRDLIPLVWRHRMGMR